VEEVKYSWNKVLCSLIPLPLHSILSASHTCLINCLESESNHSIFAAEKFSYTFTCIVGIRAIEALKGENH